MRIEARYVGDQPATLTLTLPFDQRQKSRLKATLDNGAPVAILLDRGTALRDGELLQTTDGQVVQVLGASEALSCVRAKRGLDLTRAAYHLGNRHIAVQIASDGLLYQHDHVLDTMLTQLGLDVSHVQAAFEPESGAYGSGHPHAVHSHGHSHGPGAHEHSHGPHEHFHGAHSHAPSAASSHSRLFVNRRAQKVPRQS